MRIIEEPPRTPATAPSGLPSLDAPWVRLQTDHYTVIGNIAPSYLRRAGLRLEQLHHALFQLAPDARLTAPRPTVLYVFARRDQLTPYVPPSGLTAVESGFLAPHEHGNYAAIYVGEGARAESLDAKVQRQLINQFLQTNLPALPEWYRQGVAEQFSTFELAGGTARLAPVQAGNRRSMALPLFKRSWLPLDELFTTNSSNLSSGQAGGDTRFVSLFYMQSWALVHYLTTGPDEVRLQTREYLGRIADLDDPRRAFDEVYQLPDGSALRDLVVEHLREDRAARGVEIQPLTEIQPTSVTLEDAEALTALGHLLAHSRPSDSVAAAAHYQAALERDPGQGAAHAGLGFLAYRDEDFAQASWHYRQALTGAREDDFLLRYLFAESLLRPFTGQRAQGEEELMLVAEARAALTACLDASPDFAPCWERLGYAWSIEPEASPEAVTALQQAQRLLPGRTDITFNLMLAHARLGQREGVDTAVERLRQLGADKPTLQRAREMQLQLDYRDAMNLLRQDRHAEALALLQIIVEESQSPQLLEQAELWIGKLQQADAN